MESLAKTNPDEAVGRAVDREPDPQQGWEEPDRANGTRGTGKGRHEENILQTLDVSFRKVKEAEEPRHVGLSPIQDGYHTKQSYHVDSRLFLPKMQCLESVFLPHNTLLVLRSSSGYFIQLSVAVTTH